MKYFRGYALGIVIASSLAFSVAVFVEQWSMPADGEDLRSIPLPTMAERAPGVPLPVEYWDEDDDPTLQPALSVLLKKCPRLASATSVMSKVRITWGFDVLANVPLLHSLGLRYYGDVIFLVGNPELLHEKFLPNISDRPLQVEYWIIGGQRSGISPRDLAAFVLCDQPLPMQTDAVIRESQLAAFTQPPSEVSKSPSARH